MSTLETQTPFHKQSEIHATAEAYNGSTEFILITDHQTSLRNSLEQVDNNSEQRSCCQTWTNRIFSRKTLLKRLPILQWLPKYSRQDAIGDLIAGFTVGLTVIPQGLAYSNVVGLPPEFGLYGSFMGCFAYVLFGTCKDSTVGSTAIASLMVYQFAQGVWQRAVLLTFLTGLIELSMAAFKLGFLVDFVSGPVSAGFTSAVALIISTSQIRNMTGIRSSGTTLLQRWISMAKDFDRMHMPDAILGLVCVVILITMRYVGRLRVGLNNDDKEQTCWQKFLNKVLWFLGVTRNATVTIGFSLWAAYLESQDNQYFRLTGVVPAGVPSIGLPPFSIDHVPGNATAGIEEVQGETFFQMVQHMGSGLLIVPLIAMLENMSVCKAFAKGKPIDATQELVAMGMANIGNSVFKGYRANGGLARSAVNNASGVRTPFANFYIGMVVVLSLMYMTEYFYYIPKTVLAAVIISAVIFQVQYHVVMPMWRSKRSDLIPGFVAFFACLVLPLEIGILIAIGINLLFILYHSARPKISLEAMETYDGIKFLKLTPDRCLVFPSVEFVRNLVLKSCTNPKLPLVIDCTYIYGADYTAAKVISSMVEDFKKRQQKIIFFNLKPSVVKIFEGLNTKLMLSYNNYCLEQQLRGEESAQPTSTVATTDVKPNATTDGGVDIAALECDSLANTASLAKL